MPQGVPDSVGTLSRRGGGAPGAGGGGQRARPAAAAHVVACRERWHAAISCGLATPTNLYPRVQPLLMHADTGMTRAKDVLHIIYKRTVKEFKCAFQWERGWLAGRVYSLGRACGRGEAGGQGSCAPPASGSEGGRWQGMGRGVAATGALPLRGQGQGHSGRVTLPRGCCAWSNMNTTTARSNASQQHRQSTEAITAATTTVGTARGSPSRASTTAPASGPTPSPSACT